MTVLELQNKLSALVLEDPNVELYTVIGFDDDNSYADEMLDEPYACTLITNKTESCRDELTFSTEETARIIAKRSETGEKLDTENVVVLFQNY